MLTLHSQYLVVLKVQRGNDGVFNAIASQTEAEAADRKH